MSNLTTWITIPVIAALIGYVTNYIAVKMIFRPLKPKKFLGFTILGLIPKRQREIAAKLGEVIETNLLSHQDIQDALKGEGMTTEIKGFLSEQVDVFTEKLISGNPMLGMFLQGEMLAQVKGLLVSQLGDVMPQFVDKVTRKLETKLSIKDVIRAKIEEFDPGRLEKIIYQISAQELRAIEILGGVLGFIIGIGQVALVEFTR